MKNLILLFCLMVTSFSIGAFFFQKEVPTSYYKPYSIYLENVTELDLQYCQADPNCMDINTKEAK